MDKNIVLVLDWGWLSEQLANPKLKSRRCFPLGATQDWFAERPDVLLKFRTPTGELVFDSSATIISHKGTSYLKSKQLIDSLPSERVRVKHVFLILEGSNHELRVTVHMDLKGILQKLDEQDPTLRLHAYDLPPRSLTIVSTNAIAQAVRAALREEDPELHSHRTDHFVRSPHILLALLSQVMELKSRDQISFISTLRCVADQLRELLTGRIHRLEKSHQALWSHWYARRISFADGGITRIAGIPDAEPFAIRVGIYTVTPGEDDVDRREQWTTYPYVIGDVINTPVDPEADMHEPPDRKRLQEAGRYIVEALSILRHIAGPSPPDILFLHGPLVNAFEMYDEGEPNYIPALDPAFLQMHGISEGDILARVPGIPSRRDGRPMWNQCMAVYGYLMNRLFELDIHVVGVVERSSSAAFTRVVLDHLVAHNIMTASLARKIRQKLERYRIGDELLLGCILDEGEYVEPLPVAKNVTRRARDAWQPVVAGYPRPAVTYLKTSSTSFPYRVEFNRATAPRDVESVMSLLYHTSRLLPEYAFPVGLDVADKYAKIPDWLSKGISAGIAAQVLAKAVATGNPRVLEQVRRLLAMSPRDFYFRPRA
ncbi:MAG TPA: DNA double-strand break repair nuclease NurA [Firmicutes bacterium]|nr:DNA double-strand break repair nuclease NurA [Bacillota bacterium]